MNEKLIPLIGLVACNQTIGLHPYNIVGEKYLLSVVNAAGGWPLIIPSLNRQFPMETILDRLDGILLTGSPSNIEPHHYNGPASAEGTHHDKNRDATSLPLIHAAINSGLPLLGICRGFQEMNVAFGGSLYQRLHEEQDYIEHREDKKAPLDVQYGISHKIKLAQGGILNKAWPFETAEVNSVHTQGIHQLGDGLRPEAYAPDGLIEAISVKDAKEFALGVQWHPEWKVTENTFYQAIFKSFGDACLRHAKTRNKTNNK